MLDKGGHCRKIKSRATPEGGLTMAGVRSCPGSSQGTPSGRGERGSQLWLLEQGHAYCVGKREHSISTVHDFLYCSNVSEGGCCSKKLEFRGGGF